MERQIYRIGQKIYKQESITMEIIYNNKIKGSNKMDMRRNPKDHIKEEVIGRDKMASSSHIKQMETSRLPKDKTKLEAISRYKMESKDHTTEEIISRDKMESSSHNQQVTITRSTMTEVIMYKNHSKEVKLAKDITVLSCGTLN